MAGRAELARRARGLALLGLAAAVCAPRALRAQTRAERDEGDRASRAQCEYVTAVAASQGALWRSPWVLSSFGTLRGGGDTGLDDAVQSGDELVWRLQLGLGFSPTRFIQASLLDDQARAECERYRAEEELRALATSPDGVTAAGLSAKIEVLERALPEAEELLEQSTSALEESRTTLQEHAALSLRVDDLRQRLADASLQRASLPPAPDRPRAGSSVFARLRGASARKEDAAAGLRQSQAVQLTLRGGYDKLFGVAQDLPVFGQIALELSPGWFWQRAHDERAERAHAELVVADRSRAQVSVGDLRRRLLAELAIVRRREAEVGAVLGDLASRLERLDAESGGSAREYAEYLWFDVVRLRADQALLERQRETLERATGGGETP
jgi:hypothetical protein